MIGFINPRMAWRNKRVLQREQVPERGGLFEAGILLRRHNHPQIISLGEEWFRLWQIGFRRDQPLLMIAARKTGATVTPISGYCLRDANNPWLTINAHEHKRTRVKRSPNRIAAELSLFRLWLPQ
jgi:hypothetical protein